MTPLGGGGRAVDHGVGRGVGRKHTEIFVLSALFSWESRTALKKRKVIKSGVPVVAQWKGIRIVSMRMWVQALASLSGLRIQCCHRLWCRSQMGLGSGVAVAVV